MIRLGVASGILKGVEIDTAFFDGNHAPEIAVQACFAPSASDTEIIAPNFADWHTVLSRQECGPSRRQAWLLPPGDDTQYTHVRLQMFPDGGIARFRLYGKVVPVLPQSLDERFDLAAAVNGGVAVACSDQHFGTRHNLLLPGRGVDMGDGWETKRTRGVHIDWTIIKLGVSGRIDRLVIDTAHFRGNFPQKVQVYAAKPTLDGSAPAHEDHAAWIQILAPAPSGPDAEHEYSGGQLENVTDQVYGFVKLVIIPDGGVKRIRVFGRRVL